MAGTPDTGLPPVTVRVNPRATRYTLRRVAGQLVLTAPPTASAAEISDVTARLLPRLLAAERRRGSSAGARHYSTGQVIDTPFFSVVIARSPAPGGSIRITRRAEGSWAIELGAQVSETSPQTTSAITSLLMRLARHTASAVILDDARRIAAALGAEPREWRTGLALRTLGTCTAARTVTLSAALAFLPENLRRYIVCHELAHLREMNHSPRFHRLCNDYCLRITGLAESHLRTALRRHPWPIIR